MASLEDFIAASQDYQARLVRFALKAASSPVLISLVPLRDQPQIGQPPLQKIWLINDLPRPLKVHLKVKLEGPAQLDLSMLAGSAALEVDAQSTACLFRMGDYYETSSAAAELAGLERALQSLKPDAYRLIAEAWEKKILIARTEITLSYLKPILSPEDSRA